MGKRLYLKTQSKPENGLSNNITLQHKSRPYLEQCRKRVLGK